MEACKSGKRRELGFGDVLSGQSPISMSSQIRAAFQEGYSARVASELPRRAIG